ncbi:hypothetical protein QIH36_27465, partial [Klebsiella pneumoniae]|nr:hypothetical protein [Klebsiella pneumoniae]
LLRDFLLYIVFAILGLYRLLGGGLLERDLEYDRELDRERVLLYLSRERLLDRLLLKIFIQIYFKL